MLTFMANYVGKAGDLRYNIANRLLNQFVNFLNMEIQMI